MTAASPAAPSGAGYRLAEIDLLRGFVIVLMALDHIRDYMHAGGILVNPLDPAQTTPLLYATRWVTHLCAPTFVLLAGVSAYMQRARGKSAQRLSALLFTRGLWLIFLELTLLSFGWSFSVPYLLFFQVIWAIGWSMIGLAALVFLPRLAVLAIGVAIVAGHNLLDPVSPASFGEWGLLWTFVHEGGPIFRDGAPAALVAYPILPWFGVMALGYGAGALFLAPNRMRVLPALGAAMVALFLVLRGFNLYGNPGASADLGPFGAVQAWQNQEGAAAMIMAFLDVQKYPPSLMFVLVTLGAALMLLPLLARAPAGVARVLAAFGAVPFFFYLLHVYLVHIFAIAANWAAGKDAGALFGFMANIFVAPGGFEGLGFSLGVVYLAWIVLLALLYPLCAWWAALKRRRKDWWLSYL